MREVAQETMENSGTKCLRLGYGKALAEKDPQVSAAENGFIRVCRCCGRTFLAPTNNTLNCPECKKALRKQQSSESYQRFLAREELRKMRENGGKGRYNMEQEKDGVPVRYWTEAINMLAEKAGMSYGKIRVWAQFHGEEYAKWAQEVRRCYQKLAADGSAKKGVVVLPEYVPESLPTRPAPPPCEWSGERHKIWD